LNPFDFVEINGMEVKPPEKVYSVLWEGLTGDRISYKDAESLLNETFHDNDKRVSMFVIFLYDMSFVFFLKCLLLTRHCSYLSIEFLFFSIFMIDEFDSLISKRSIVFSNLLEWTALPNSGFVLIALTNEIRLSHSLLTKSQESKFGLYRYL